MTGSAHKQNSAAIPDGIKKLHQDDIAVTLTRDADALTALWDDDAVLLQPGALAIVGKAAFRDLMKQAFVNSPAVKVVKYTPDVRDVQVVGQRGLRVGILRRGAEEFQQASTSELVCQIPSCHETEIRWALEVHAHHVVSRLIWLLQVAQGHNLFG